MTPNLTPIPNKSYCKKGDVRFNLKLEKNKTANLQIFLVFNFDGKRLRYYTGKRINLVQWDAINQKVKSNVELAMSINGFLKSLANLVSTEYNNAKALGQKPSIEYLRNKLQNFDSRSSESFLDSFQVFINRCKNEKASKTLVKYTNTKNHIEKFSTWSGYKLDFESIDLKFEEKFRDYLINQKNLNNNTIAKIFKVIKVFMNHALETGKTKSVDFMKFKAREFEGDIVFLTWEELMRLYNKEDFSSESLKRIRDIFCFGCFTGLRFSDIMNLKCENIRNGTIYINTIKNKKSSIIPLNKYSETIVNRYLNDEREGFLFPKISNQKMNDYLKDLGKEAEFNDKITLVNFKGSVRNDETWPKYELLSTHVARKTFITNALDRGMPSEVIMDITGHASHKVFKRYYKIIDDQRKREMMKAFS
jgi:integrase